MSRTDLSQLLTLFLPVLLQLVIQFNEKHQPFLNTIEQAHNNFYKAEAELLPFFIYLFFAGNDVRHANHPVL